MRCAVVKWSHSPCWLPFGKPTPRERRAIRAKEERRQRQRANFADSAAFAYFKGWPLNMRVTVTWDRCFWGDRDHGHVLTLIDDTDQYESFQIEASGRLWVI